MLIPAFHRCEVEAAIIGRIMGGFGELELGLGFCVSYAVEGKRDDVLCEIFRVWNAGPRIDRTEKLGINRMRELGLEGEFAHVLKQVRHSLQIRNNYSHCHWGDVDGRLFFTKLQEAAKMNGFPLKWREINRELLQLQEGFCVNHARVAPLPGTRSKMPYQSSLAQSSKAARPDGAAGALHR
jgi:hypothetical protein